MIPHVRSQASVQASGVEPGRPFSGPSQETAEAVAAPPVASCSGQCLYQCLYPVATVTGLPLKP